jgi:uncharacterized protein with ParB-like and HNH nuclease domain
MLLKEEATFNRIQKTYLINEFAPEEEKLKLKPTENNKEALKYILSSNEDEFRGYSKIIENYNYFKSVINEENFEIILKGLSKLIFIDISLDRQKDNPQRIFESLNSTGLELSQADLIRNYILMDLSRSDQDYIYKTYWEIIERNAKDETLNKTKISEFIRDFLTLKNKEIPNKGEVYAKFKLRYPTKSIDELRDTLSELKSLVVFYNKLNNPQNENDIEIRTQLEFINRLEINVAYPFLMKVYEDYKRDVINKQSFISILVLIQSFVFRRFVLGLPTNALNKIFMNLYEKVDFTNYLASVQKSLVIKTGVQRFPRDLETINALLEKDVYNIKPKNRTYLFERLENYQNNEVIVIEGNSTITLEHIFPQNPDTRWKLELDKEDYDNIKEKYINTIGNLTLSGNNGKLSNKYFLEKREMNIDNKEQGYAYSRLWLNRSLKNLNKWGLEEIHERAKLLSDRFIKIWDFPNIQIEETVDVDEVNIFDAEDPRFKKLEYAVFFGRKIFLTQVSKLYITVFKELFDLQPETFFSSEIGKRIGLTKNPSLDNIRQPIALDNVYFIESNIDNIGKFDRIKFALTVFGFEDELYIKYAVE